MFVSDSQFWRMPPAFSGLQRAPRSTFKIPYLLMPLYLFLNADEARLGDLQKLRGRGNDDLVVFMRQKGIQQSHLELRYLRPLQKRLRHEVALLVDQEIKDDTTTEARVHQLVRHLNASRETIRWSKCAAAEYVKGYDEFFGKRTILPFTGKYVITEITESNTVRSPKAGFYHILRALIRNGLLKLKRCKYRECSQFFVPENLKEKFCSIECRKTLDGKDALLRVRNYRKKEARRKKAVAAKREKAAALREKNELLAYLKSWEFRKCLPGGPNERTKKQGQEIQRLGAASSVREYIRDCDPVIRKIIENHGPTIGL